MRETRPSPRQLDRLPDFCSLPILFALLLVSGMTVAVMALTPSAQFSWRGVSTTMAFAVWLALANGVALCKLRPLLLRLPGMAAFAGVWLVIVAIAIAGSFVTGWLDTALALHLAPPLPRFVAASAGLSALIGAALLRYFHVVAQWQARQAASAQARVDALQARIRPHFLFNSMNTVAALVRVDADAAERTVENLSALFRAALGSDGDSNLGEELDLVSRYLAIEQWRLGDRLQVEQDVAALPRALAMPRLLLQPLAENAVRHGIQPSTAGGVVRIHGDVDADHVVLTVSNPLVAGTADSAGSGVGLDSVRQRLGYHFGARSRLDITREQGRFEVRLRLPWATQ